MTDLLVMVSQVIHPYTDIINEENQHKGEPKETLEAELRKIELPSDAPIVTHMKSKTNDHSVNYADKNFPEKVPQNLSQSLHHFNLLSFCDFIIAQHAAKCNIYPLIFRKLNSRHDLNNKNFTTKIFPET